MDPSSNNSFGSFSSGGISGGSDFVGGGQPANNGLNAATNSVVADNGGAATNDFGAQVPGSSDAGARVFGVDNTDNVGINVDVNSGVAMPAQAGQPLQQQNQVLAQQIMQSQPYMVASGNGDVIFGGSELKKPKKGMIAIIVVTVIAIVCIAVGAWAWMFLNKEPEDDNKNADVSFEEFVSYVASGDISFNYDISTFNAMRTYAIDDFFEKSGTEEAARYFEKLDEMWQSIAKGRDFNASDWDGANVISSDLEALAVYMRRNATEEDVLLRKYIEGGDEALRVYNVNYYDSNNNSWSDTLLSYMASWDDYAKSLVGVFKSYIENGCVVNNKINYECLEKKGIYLQNAYRQLEFAKNNLIDYAADVEYEVKWRIEKITTIGEETNS